MFCMFSVLKFIPLLLSPSTSSYGAEFSYHWHIYYSYSVHETDDFGRRYQTKPEVCPIDSGALESLYEVVFLYFNNDAIDIVSHSNFLKRINIHHRKYMPLSVVLGHIFEISKVHRRFSLNFIIFFSASVLLAYEDLKQRVRVGETSHFKYRLAFLISVSMD